MSFARTSLKPREHLAIVVFLAGTHLVVGVHWVAFSCCVGVGAHVCTVALSTSQARALRVKEEGRRHCLLVGGAKMRIFFLDFFFFLSDSSVHIENTSDF